MPHSIPNLWLVVPFLYLATHLVDGHSGSYDHPKPHYASHGGSQPYLPAPTGKRPPCAEPSETFCTEIDYYPTEIIEYLVKRYSFDFKTLLQDESMDSMTLMTSNVTAPQTHVSEYPTVVAKQPYIGPYANGKLAHDQWWPRYVRVAPKRQQSTASNIRATRQVSNEEQLCPTRSAFIAPRTAVNTRGNWMYVVNLEGADQQNTQLVRTERCAQSECSGLCQIPAGFNSRCTQQFVQKRLVALDGNGESLYTDTFWFPHCCICQITSNV